MAERTTDDELADELEIVIKHMASKYYARGLFGRVLRRLRSISEGERHEGWVDQITDIDKFTTVFASGDSATPDIHSDWFPATLIIPTDRTHNRS